MEILHDMNTQIRDMEDQMADSERLKEKTASNWSQSVIINLMLNILGRTNIHAEKPCYLL